MSRLSKNSKPKVNTVGGYVHHYIGHLNNSKLFAGVVMILLNVGTKLIPIQISNSAEEYMKKSISKHLLVFAMAWMGTRDIYTSFGLMCIFIVLSEYMFNDQSKLCVIPAKYKTTDTEAIGNRVAESTQKINQTDISAVIKLLEDIKAKV